MDIVLNTKFDNPRLPLIPLQGFRDDFDRGASDSLGSTSDGKPWTIYDSGSSTSTWGTYGDGTAGMKDSSSQYHLAVADGLASDGTLTAEISTVNEAERRPGLALRCVDSDNFIYLAQASSSNHTLRIAKRIAGDTTTLSEVGPALQAGDKLIVTLDGPRVIVNVNGEEAMSVLIPEHANATQHGLYAFSGAVGTWESIAFNPA